MNILEKSWNNIPKEICSKYLDGIGHPSLSSRDLLIAIIEKKFKKKENKLIDIGCGNGNLCKYLNEKKINLHYTGIDFSQNLIEFAKNSYPDSTFILGDVITLNAISNKYDIAIYSHVIETLSSPEESLYNASNLSNMIIIRFFEPPIHKFDSAHILSLDLAHGQSPYLRRKLSSQYYQLILNTIQAKEVHVYQDHKSNDQIHVIILKEKGKRDKGISIGKCKHA